MQNEETKIVLNDIAALEKKFNALAANSNLVREDRALFALAVDDAAEISNLIQKNETRKAADALKILSATFNFFAGIKDNTSIQAIYADCGKDASNLQQRLQSTAQP